MQQCGWGWLAIAMLAATSGCGGEETSSTPAPRVRQQARILDAETRAALGSVDEDWTLRFGTITDQVAQMAPPQVLVSEQTPAAPFGLLRRVVSVTNEGSDVVVVTGDAELGHVLAQGGFSIEADLRPEDILASYIVHADGTRDPYPIVNFDFHFDENLARGVHVEGGFRFKTHLGLSWRIINTDALFDDLDPFDAFDPEISLSFGIEEGMDLMFTMAALEASGDVPVFESYFQPIHIQVGPVPVILTPRLVVEAGYGAGLRYGGERSFGAHQEFTALVGARCNLDGCSRIWDFNREFEFISADVDPTQVGFGDGGFSGRVTGRIELLVYGIVGPYADLEPSVAMFVHSPGDPTWTVSGGIRVGGGLSVSPLGIRWSHDFLNESWAIAEAPNYPPTVRIRSPRAGERRQLGQPIQIVASALDPELGAVASGLQIHEGSTLLGVTGAGGILSHVFDTPGVHEITARFVDDAGQEASASVSFEAVNTPPEVRVEQVEEAITGFYTRVRVTVVDANQPGGLACEDSTWESTAPADTFTGLCSASRGYVDILYGTEGTRTVTLTATDEWGATGSDSFDVAVTSPPAGGLSPSVALTEPTETLLVNGLSGTHDLMLNIRDRDSPSATWEWTVSWGGCSSTDGRLCINRQVLGSGNVTAAEGLADTGGVEVGVRGWNIFDVLPFPSRCYFSYPVLVEWRVQGEGDAAPVSGSTWTLVVHGPC